jgi:hypothetical protein
MKGILTRLVEVPSLRKAGALLTAAALLLLTGIVQAAVTQTVDWRVIGGGGGHAEAAPYALDGTIGQAVVGVDSNGPYDLCAGFWCRPRAAACEQITGVTISGPTTGVGGTTYTFGVTITPPTATLPIAYTWSPAPDSGQGTANASYTWTTPGTRSIQVTVSNCGGAGTATDTHTITIESHIYLPLVLRDFS